MQDFNFKIPQEIVFGMGRLNDLPELVRKCSSDHALIVSDRGLADLGIVSRVQTILGILDRPAPYQQQLAEQGAFIDMKYLTDILGKYSGVPEIGEVVKFSDRPEAGPHLPPKGDPRPDYVSTKSPVTHRVYERVNRPGATTQGRDAAMMQTLLGGRAQPAEMAALSMSRPTA